MSDELTTYTRPATAIEVRAQVNLIQEVLHAVMKNGHHYGTVPGTDKPTLFKAGAEKLFLTFRIAVTQQVEDLSGPDVARYRVTATAQHVVTQSYLGSATGEASTDEDKYRWRRAVCDEEFDATPEDRRRIKWSKYQGKATQTKQVRTNPSDVANTVLKMAAKRAEVALALRVTAASDIFTQDIEDLPEDLREAADDRPPLRQPERKSASDPAPQPEVIVSDEGGDVSLLAGVTIAAVSVKPGEKNGKAFTKISVKIGDSWYATFDTALQDFIETAKAHGTKVNLTYVRKGDYYNIVGIENAS